ncbi:cell wall metabolism sensor histidine kinase WalK [Clostridium sp. MSJ-8]|uniref:sensor histidine kinase n=1 Tax=Clostridium sp. MSJ-8 TaxID=2841510 RepID=UPI00209F15EA|nr:HAMP domain-containing sensor histidine kinase [Clostridium sp. MSJ-8]
MINDKLHKILKKIYNFKIFNPIRKYIDKLWEKIEKSIRFELMAVIAVCFACSALFYIIANDSFSKREEVADVTYDYESIESEAKDIISEINQDVTGGSDFLQSKCNEAYDYYNAKAFITDLDGKILYKSENVEEDTVDIFLLLANNANVDVNNGQEKRYIFPLTIGENRYYFIYSDVPTASIKYNYYTKENSILAILLSLVVFAILFISITNAKMKYLDEIADGLKKIANDDLHYRIREDGRDEIRNLASNINYMADEINRKIIAERQSEQAKSDLITNVSHDLRTPLTSIMGYIGLVKEGKYDDEDEMKEYLNIAFSKAEKLKVLINDLFEYTKLSSEGIKINKVRVNLIEFLSQLSEELMPLFEQNNLELVSYYGKEEGIQVDIDPDKMVRVFDNLFTNAIKYSYKPGVISVDVVKDQGYVTVVIRNRGENIPKEKIEKLFDRFYRVEESRNTQTGGTGLGLAISKNIVELHGGNIWAECFGAEISFFVKLRGI